ncbi:MAG: hypothetical protein GY915_07085 [bacterium]|nr:hypothetical protein [bacterium]
MNKKLKSFLTLTLLTSLVSATHASHFAAEKEEGTFVTGVALCKGENYFILKGTFNETDYNSRLPWDKVKCVQVRKKDMMPALFKETGAKSIYAFRAPYKKILIRFLTKEEIPSKGTVIGKTTGKVTPLYRKKSLPKGLLISFAPVEEKAEKSKSNWLIDFSPLEEKAEKPKTVDLITFGPVEEEKKEETSEDSRSDWLISFASVVTPTSSAPSVPQKKKKNPTFYLGRI